MKQGNLGQLFLIMVLFAVVSQELVIVRKSLQINEDEVFSRVREKLMKKIVVLDGYTLNPGDLTWKDLESLGKCAVYDRTPPKEVVPRAKDSEIVLTNKTVLSSEAIKQLPKLKYIGVLATGYNIVDTETAHTRSIPVTNVPAYSTKSME